MIARRRSKWDGICWEYA